jgi:ankyrin repeat protein
MFHYYPAKYSWAEIENLIVANDYDGVEKLLKRHGVSVLGTTDFEGRSPLHVACNRGHVAIVQLLLDYGAAIDALDAFDQTPLYSAASAGRADVIDLLCFRQANMSFVNRMGTSPAHCCAHGCLVALETFCAFDLDVGELMDDGGFTVLITAVYFAQEQNVRLLLQLNVDTTNALTFLALHGELATQLQIFDEFNSKSVSIDFLLFHR